MVSSPEPIAIVGAGCRFPGGASRPSKLWELLQSPRNVATPIPKDRFSLDAFYHPSGPHHGTTNVKESYFLSEIDALHFDAAFFNMAPSEADPMDPQHRHLLEVVYEAMEDAGIMMEELQGSNTSVFVGLMCTDYYGMASRDLDAIPTYGATGVAASNASSRISYFFDWHG
jgi:acyl transferase domain-containing protein